MIKGFINAIILIVLIETLYLILPEGKTSGIVKWSFSLIITIALIIPIFSIFNDDFKINKTYNLQANYLINSNEIAVEFDKNVLKNKLKRLGINKCDVVVEYSLIDEKIKYQNVIITIENEKVKDKNIIIDEVKSVFGDVKVYI